MDEGGVEIDPGRWLPFDLTERRPLGFSGIQVSPVGMGCSRLGAFWQRRSPAMGLRTLATAREAGINLFDTADVYARGISERMVGRAFRRCRDEVVICTKVGALKTPLALRHARAAERAAGGPRNRGRGARGGGAGATLRGFLPGPGAAGCFLPDYVTGAAERSLRRLRTGHVDVLLLHGPPLATIEEGAFVPALERLVEQGKVRSFGLSCATVEEATAALRLPGLSSLQLPYSLLARSPVEKILPEARERGVGVVAAQPFAEGSLFALAERELPEADRDLVGAAALRFAAGAGLASVLVGMSRPENVARNMRAASEPHPQERLAAIGARLGAAAAAGGEGRA
jgi:aryl-alcohol dehydrogenase-like predicted oxidoreductase